MLGSQSTLRSQCKPALLTSHRNYILLYKILGGSRAGLARGTNLPTKKLTRDLSLPEKEDKEAPRPADILPRPSSRSFTMKKKKKDPPTEDLLATRPGLAQDLRLFRHKHVQPEVQEADILQRNRSNDTTSDASNDGRKV